MIVDKFKSYSKPLQLSIEEGMFYSIMVGAAMTFVVAFAVYLGANSFEVGLLSAVPALFASWIQLASIKLLHIYKKRKPAIIITVLVQATSWLLIAAIPFIFPQNQVFWLILLTTIGTAIGSIGGPLWQSWIKSITPKEIIGEYFGVRNSLTGAIVLIVTILCGIFLRVIDPSKTLLVFMGIFLISFLGRIISSFLFFKIEDPEFQPIEEKIHLFSFIKQLGKDNFGHFVLFGTLWSFTLAMVGPFLSFYLLEFLGLSNDYLLYTLIICAPTLTALISMPYWGKAIDKYGTITILKATALLTIIHPIALILIRDPITLILVELFEGIGSAGLALALTNFIYHAFDNEKIIKYSAYQATLFGSATFIGTIIVGYLLMFNISLPILTNTFYIVCIIAAGLRITLYALMLPKVKEITRTGESKSESIVVSVLTFRPIVDPVLSNFIPLVSMAESATINGVKRIEALTKKELTLAEEVTINEVRKIEELTEKEIERVELAGKKSIERIERAAKKKKKK
jgi:MFS family permease